jgi:hypothetical protein
VREERSKERMRLLDKDKYVGLKRRKDETEKCNLEKDRKKN